MTEPSRTGGAEAWSAADTFIFSAALGLLTGFVDVSLVAIAAFGLDRWTHRNPQIAWLAPLAYALIFVVLTAVVLLAGRRIRRERIVRAVVFITAMLGGAGVLFTYQKLHRVAALIVAAGVAVQFSWLVVRYPALFRRWSRRLVLPLGALVLLAFAGLNGRWWWLERRALADLPTASTDAPNVLLIIWDTVRASHLSVFGYPRETTPTLERMALEGAAFEHAYSTAPWTTPSHASMFTGLYPPQLSTTWRWPLDSEPVVLAEVLASKGYRTAGITANTYATSRESGLSRGFSHWDDFHVFSWGDLLYSTTLMRALVGPEQWRHRFGIDKPLGHKDAYRVDEEFLSWLSRDPSRPFFAFLNFFDAHGPYQPPAPFDTMWGPLLPGRNPWMATGRTYTDRELQAEIDAYDGAITFLDNRLEVLLAELESRGVLDNTIVIVTSDHGEEFGEHGVFTHGHSMYDGALHVPLLIRWPGGVPAGLRPGTFVTNRDVPATILDLAGIRDVHMPGRSLARYWSGDEQRDAAPDTLVATVNQVSGNPPQYPVSQNDIRVLFADPWKLIANGDESVELYDLRSDPGETNDRADEEVAVRDRMRSALEHRLSEWRAGRD